MFILKPILNDFSDFVETNKIRCIHKKTTDRIVYKDSETSEAFVERRRASLINNIE